MRILLPPSEGKRSGGDGPPLAELGFEPGPVGRHRARLCAAVERTAGRSRRTAMTAFALPETVADTAIAANVVVTTSPTRPALDRYAGVVFDGLAAATMTSAERAAADETVLIFSGLFGALTGSDPVPEYRVPAASVLPRIGVVGASWRPVLTTALPARLHTGSRGVEAGPGGPDHDLVVDLRSTDYAPMWRVPGSLDSVSVRILTEMPDGRLMVVSYVSKLAKGRLARALIERVAAGEPVSAATDVARAWIESGLGRPTSGTELGSGRLELITTPAG